MLLPPLPRGEGWGEGPDRPQRYARILGLSLVFAVACRGQQAIEPPPPSEPPPDLQQALVDDGFLVQPGTQTYYDPSDCCDRTAFCLYNNPSSPYGYLSLPPGPDQTGVDLEPTPDGNHRWFHLRRDEAIVVFGTAPPEARYFSFRSYVATRSSPLGWLGQLVIGSLGPSMNHLVMAEQRGDAIWGQPYVVVSTADRGVEARVHAALARAGVDPRNVSDDRIPDALVKLGLGPDADRLLATSRVAVFADRDAGDAYVDDPGATVLRLTPEVPVDPPQPHPIAPLPEKGAGTDESAWDGATAALEDAIVARWSGRPVLRMTSVAGRDVDALDCLTSLASCGGEINDRYYALLGEPFQLGDGDDRFVVVFGVNHQRTGKASYANFSVDTAAHLLAIDGVDSDQMVGSARFYVPDLAEADDLYAWTVARSCAGHTEPCLEVPVGCPGAPFADDLSVSFRAYLEPATGAAPVYEELVADRALAFGAVSR